MKAAGTAADGVVFPVRTGVVWGGEAPGMGTVREISRISDPGGNAYRPVHYLAGICSAFYMKEAMDQAAAAGGITGDAIRQSMYRKQNWVPAGLDGVCVPSTWTAEDHRGTTTVAIYRAKVS